MISVGIDVSKDKSTVCILKPGGEVLAAPFEMLHTMKDVLALVKRLKAYDEEVRVVLEATGHYHWPVVCLLAEKGIFVACINALQMKKFCSQNLRRAKTDRIDAIKIASFGIAYWNDLISVLPGTDIYDELRTFSRQYYQYTSLVVKAKINLRNLLDQTMPGIQSLLVNQNGGHKLTDFVEQYWHFGNILILGEQAFYCKLLPMGRRKGIPYERAQSKRNLCLVSKRYPCPASHEFH